ncbi:MAG: DUF3592 domain-containing protein [Chitinivibrionales bacterium]|nr:DUF3592 domain-containing protein [Chitinivibrionales bacterium]
MRGRITKALILLLIAFWALSAYLFIDNHFRSSRSPSWLSTEGTVVATSIDERSSSESVGREYHVYVKYIYVIDGEYYASSQVGFTFPFNYGDRADAEKVVAKYPVGERVQVFYDPQRPQDACLEPGRTPLWFTGGAVVMLLLMIVVTGYGYVEYSDGTRVR